MVSVEALVTKLRELGGSANNPDLKRALGVDNEDWEIVKRSAIKTGAVIVGKGFGGRLSLADGIGVAPIGRKATGSALPSLGRSNFKGKKIVVLDKEFQQKATGTISEFAEGDGAIMIILE